MPNKTSTSTKNIILRKGLTETTYQTVLYLFHTLRIGLTLTFLRARGYNIDSSVKLRRNTHFFQSNKAGITIKQQCEIGDSVKISSGQQGKIIIEKNVAIYDYTYIDIHDKLTIGENTLIAPFCYIIDYDHKVIQTSGEIKKDSYTEEGIQIGKNVWIGAHAVILKGVTIGDNAIIGAGAIVTKDVPPFSVAVGNPAHVIKKIK